MARPLRILHTADSHIGAALPVRPLYDRPRRGPDKSGVAGDLVRSFTRVLGWAPQNGIDLVIHAGDLFNRSKPSSRALVDAAEPLLTLAAAGIPVVIVPGNHERSTIPACLMLSHPNIHIIAEPCTVTLRLRGTRVGVSAIPCLRCDSARHFPGMLEATGWSKAGADLKVLAVHQTFESATCGPVGYRFRSGKDVVERRAVPAAFDYVAAGHIHRHQTLTTPTADGPFIVYAGSPDRVSFAEADEPKGFVVVEESGGRLVHTFVEHEVRPMLICPMDVTGLTNSQILQRIESIVQGLPSRAIARVRLTGRSAAAVSARGSRTTHNSSCSLWIAATARKLRPDVLLSFSAGAANPS